MSRDEDWTGKQSRNDDRRISNIERKQEEIDKKLDQVLEYIATQKGYISATSVIVSMLWAVFIIFKDHLQVK